MAVVFFHRYMHCREYVTPGRARHHKVNWSVMMVPALAPIQEEAGELGSQMAPVIKVPGTQCFSSISYIWVTWKAMCVTVHASTLREDNRFI
jgi:hypothetical protein